MFITFISFSQELIEGIAVYKFKKPLNDSVYWYSDAILITESDTFGFGGFNFSLRLDSNNRRLNDKVDWEKHISPRSSSENHLFIIQGRNGYLSKSKDTYYWMTYIKANVTYHVDEVPPFQYINNICPVETEFDDDSKVAVVNSYLDVKVLTYAKKKELCLSRTKKPVYISFCD